MKIRALIVLSMLVAGAAQAQKAKKADAPKAGSDRYGVPILDSRELVSKVAIVGMPGTSAQAMLTSLHKQTHSKEPLAVDDADPDAHVWMFGTPIANAHAKTSGGDYKVRIEFTGLDGTSHSRMSEVAKPAHIVVVMLKGDESKDAVDEAVKTLRTQMRPDRVDQIAVWSENGVKGAFSVPAIAGKGPAGLVAGIVKIIQSGKPLAKE